MSSLSATFSFLYHQIQNQPFQNKEKVMYIHLIFASFFFGTQASTILCKTTTTRKEAHDLTRVEWSIFANAYKVLGIPDKNTGLSYLDIASNTHSKYAFQAHGSAQFIAYHRKFMLDFEIKLQSIDSRAFIPYWDWSQESANPGASSIWQYLGHSNGVGRCLKDGLFKDIVYAYSTFSNKARSSDGKGYCLSRNWQAGSLFSPQMLGSFFTAAKNDYAAFELSLELVHGNVHIMNGCDMASMVKNDNELSKI